MGRTSVSAPSAQKSGKMDGISMSKDPSTGKKSPIRVNGKPNTARPRYRKKTKKPLFPKNFKIKSLMISISYVKLSVQQRHPLHKSSKKRRGQGGVDF